VDTDRLAGGFIARTLPKSEWTHEAHLRVGLWHTLHYPRDAALALLRDRIRGYNVATGVQNTSSEGYHETITRFYLAVIGGFLASVDSGRPIDDLAQELIARFDDRNLPLRHYTRERLFSADARLGWLEPDLEPLPGA
jgi:hypothetical protein